jgi:hypothetical protein
MQPRTRDWFNSIQCARISLAPQCLTHSKFLIDVAPGVEVSTQIAFQMKFSAPWESGLGKKISSWERFESRSVLSMIAKVV